jgi:HSP20 family molecular chaperone IbpA
MNTTTRDVTGREAQPVARGDAARNEAPAMSMPVDVIEDPSGITLRADMPGVPKDKLHLEIDADTLTIRGEMQLDLPADMESTHAEVSVPRYHRAFTLSKELDSQAVTAEFAQGVLTLRIPKAQHAQPRKIEIRAH